MTAPAIYRTRAEEDRQAKAMRLADATWAEIAEELGISAQAARGRYARTDWASGRPTRRLSNAELNELLDALVILPYDRPASADEYLNGYYTAIEAARRALPGWALDRLVERSG